MSDLCPVGCDRPRSDNWSICAVCGNGLRQDLAELPALASDLHRILTRYNSGFVSGTGAGGDAMPYNLKASEALSHTRAVLVGWIRDLDDNPEHHPADNLAAMATWLLRRHHQLCTHPAAEEVIREITDITTTARRLTDGPPDRVFAGICDTDGCNEHLMAIVKRPHVTCRACATVHDVAERREAMEEALADKLVSAAEFATLTTWLAWPLDRHRVRTVVNVWAHRGVIVPAGHGEDGPRYPFGELRAKVEERFALARIDLTRSA